MSTVKNEVYKGFNLFMVELRKHLQNKTLGSGFWKEMGGRTSLPIHYTFKDVKHTTLLELVNWYIENHESVTETEFNQLLNEFGSLYWILNKKGFFTLEADYSKKDTPVAVTADPVVDETVVEAVPEDKVQEEAQEQATQTESVEKETAKVVAEKATNAAKKTTRGRKPASK